MPVISVKNLYKDFGKLRVLDGVSVDIKKGEKVVIIGASGSGKSTILRCLNFLEEANEGTISIGGKVIYQAGGGKKMTDTEIRQNRLHFGLVFQSFNLFPQYSVLRNITLAPEMLELDKFKAEHGKKPSHSEKKQITDRIESHAMELLTKVGLADKMKSYPFQLSGGQSQRVAIARALALAPDILCFDEPTSALDPELTGEVLKVIRELKNDNRTMIVVTHEMEFARGVADKVIYMADGVIEEMGTPEEVFGNPQSPKTRAFLSKSAIKG